MIAQLLDLARRGAGGADCLWRRAERTSISFESGRLKAAGINEEAGVNLRVVSGGRVGIAGSTAAEVPPAELVARAVAAAELGELLVLDFPLSAALPRVPTSFDRAATAPLDALIAIGRELAERLAREGCQVNVTVEREVAEPRVANTAGADGAYPSTAVAISAEVWRIAGNDVLAIGDGFEGSSPGRRGPHGVGGVDPVATQAGADYRRSPRGIASRGIHPGRAFGAAPSRHAGALRKDRAPGDLASRRESWRASVRLRVHAGRR